MHSLRWSRVGRYCRPHIGFDIAIDGGDHTVLGFDVALQCAIMQAHKCRRDVPQTPAVEYTDMNKHQLLRNQTLVVVELLLLSLFV